MSWTPTGDSLRGPPGPLPSWGAIGGSLSEQDDLVQALAAKFNASRLSVGPTPPPDPAPGDLWIDTT